MRCALLVVAIGCAPPRMHRAARCVPPPSGWHARIAATGGVVDAAQAPLGELAPVVVRAVAVARAPGATSLGAELEPGFLLPATVASWLHVRVDHPIAIDGWVPASARGLFYDEPRAEARPDALADTTIVYDAPADSADVVAVLDAGLPVTFGPDAGRWVRVETVAGDVRVVGWAIASLRPHRGTRTFDFGDDLIEGELVHPDGDDGGARPVPRPSRTCR